MFGKCSHWQWPILLSNPVCFFLNYFFPSSMSLFPWCGFFDGVLRQILLVMAPLLLTVPSRKSQSVQREGGMKYQLPRRKWGTAGETEWCGVSRDTQNIRFIQLWQPRRLVASWGRRERRREEVRPWSHRNSEDISASGKVCCEDQLLKKNLNSG